MKNMKLISALLVALIAATGCSNSFAMQPQTAAQPAKQAVEVAKKMSLFSRACSFVRAHPTAITATVVAGAAVAGFCYWYFWCKPTAKVEAATSLQQNQLTDSLDIEDSGSESPDSEQASTAPTSHPTKSLAERMKNLALAGHVSRSGGNAGDYTQSVNSLRGAAHDAAGRRSQSALAKLN